MLDEFTKDNYSEKKLSSRSFAMNLTFNDLVNNLRNLSLHEKIEIKHIVEKAIVDEQRKELHTHYLESKKELKENKLKFSSDINKLRKMLD